MMRKKFSERALAAAVGMSPSGFHNAINRQTLSVKDLESLSNVLGVEPAYFFEDSGGPADSVNESETVYNSKRCQKCKEKDGQISLLKNLLKEKEKELLELAQELGRRFGREKNHVA